MPQDASDLLLERVFGAMRRNGFGYDIAPEDQVALSRDLQLVWRYSGPTPEEGLALLKLVAVLQAKPRYERAAANLHCILNSVGSFVRWCHAMLGHATPLTPVAQRSIRRMLSSAPLCHPVRAGTPAAGRPLRDFGFDRDLDRRRARAKSSLNRGR